MSTLQHGVTYESCLPRACACSPVEARAQVPVLLPSARGAIGGVPTVRRAAYAAMEMNTSDPDSTDDAAEWSLGRLLSMAARLVEQDWNNWLANRDLTHAGLLALHALSSGPRAQRELAAASMVEEQTMSKVLDRLERAGYVTRQRDTADRRRLVVRRTPAGERAYRSAIDADVANTIVSARLDDPGAFRRQLTQLITGLLAARGETVPDSLAAHRASGPR